MAAKTQPVPSADPEKLRRRRALRHAASNLAVAAMFLLTLAPGAHDYGSRPANLIWMAGALAMAVLTLIRVAPVAALLTPQAIAATAGMTLLPALMRPLANSGGTFAVAGMLLMLAGTVVSQTARLFLGRRFALMPANRGIVRGGPYRYVRHPVYAGWFILAAGYVLTYPALRNAAVALLAVPFMAWRIVLEERLLGQDADYRAYCAEVRFRLLPGVF